MEAINTTRAITGMNKSGSLKYLTSLVVIILTFLALFFFFHLFESRRAFQSAQKQLHLRMYPEAEKAFAHALNSLPGGERSIFSSDLLKITLGFGDLYVLESTSIADYEKRSKLLQLAKVFFQMAADVSQLEVKAVSGLASVEAALEADYAELYPDADNPYNALKFFKLALDLYPTGTTIHYQFIDYLAILGSTEELQEAVQRIAALYPPSYHELKDKALFTLPIRNAFKAGLNRAVKDNICRGDAYRILSLMAAEDNEYILAIAYYQAFMEVSPNKDMSKHHLNLGKMFLKLQQLDKARTKFIKALSLTSDKESYIQDIFTFYTEQKLNQAFVKFAKTAEQEFSLSDLVHILMAKSFIKLDLEVLASQRLQRISSQQYSAEKFYCMAMIAQKNQNWERMEILLQKAIELVPRNRKYYALLSRVFFHQNKFEKAEYAASTAIAIAAQKGALDQWLLDNRGWIRLQRKELYGAIRDWQLAISFDEENAAFYHQLSVVYEQLRNRKAAFKYAKLALQKDPADMSYRKRLAGLDLPIKTMKE